jgi:hypothetical protein
MWKAFTVHGTISGRWMFPISWPHRSKIMNRHLLAFLTVGSFFTSNAQVNAPGKFQIGLAWSGGAHATHFKNSFTFNGLKFENSSDDGAATVSYPLDLHVGLSNKFSLGLCLEAGQYIDSAGTNPNQFVIVSLSPRFYVLNKEKNALFFNLDLGVSGLRIGDVESGTKKFDDSYAGMHVRPGIQFQHYFGNTFGMNVGLKVPFHNMKWRDRDPEDPFLTGLNYAAELRTSGVQFQLGLQVKL